MSVCPYCGVGPADSADHIFPKFLDGRRTIAACRSCNSKFGHTFEAQVANALDPVYVQLALWGVPLPERERWWRAAYEVDGARLDLAVGPSGVRAQSSASIIVKDSAGKVMEAYFVNPKDLARFESTRQVRHPEERWLGTEKQVSTNLKGLRWSLDLGPAIQQLALKMSLAASTLLPSFGQEERTAACEALQGHSGNADHPLVAHYLRCIDALSAKRPALAHTLYVEHQAERVQGIVEFFGVFRFFIDFVARTKAFGAQAVFAYLDPVKSHEHFESMSPLGLSSPPSHYTAQELIEHQVKMTQDLLAGARARGATTVSEVVLTAHLPVHPRFRI